MDGSGLRPDLVGMGSIGYPNVKGSHLIYDSYRDGVGNIGLCRGDINKGASYIKGNWVYLVDLYAQTKPVGAVMIVLYVRYDDISDVYKFPLVA